MFGTVPVTYNQIHFGVHMLWGRQGAKHQQTDPAQPRGLLSAAASSPPNTQPLIAKSLTLYFQSKYRGATATAQYLVHASRGRARVRCRR